MDAKAAVDVILGQEGHFRSQSLPFFSGHTQKQQLWQSSREAPPAAVSWCGLQLTS